MFKRNTLLLGFLVIILVGMLTYLLAWNITNLGSQTIDIQNSPMSEHQEFPPGKMILEVGAEVLENEQEVSLLLLELPGVERVFIMSEQKNMVVFYDPELIRLEAIMKPLVENGYEVKPLKF